MLRQVGQDGLNVLLLEEALAGVVHAREVDQRHAWKLRRREAQHPLQYGQLTAQRGRHHAVTLQTLLRIRANPLLGDLLAQHATESRSQSLDVPAGIGAVALEPIVLEQERVHLLERDPLSGLPERPRPDLAQPAPQAAQRGGAVVRARGFSVGYAIDNELDEPIPALGATVDRALAWLRHDTTPRGRGARGRRRERAEGTHGIANSVMLPAFDSARVTVQSALSHAHPREYRRALPAWAAR
jgi:hypothetical protein